ncbi:MAG TPA: phenylalanine--tRNA ligase subunit alpha [Candidatus Cybelea sp.]|jgi:phenylalanyl-tRNA synthetase alpha chain|nr:phenylalanine--tRNA ligase subunit alpha [Candidatus Cybelea sp.]
MTELQNQLQDVQQRFATAVDAADDGQALENVRVTYLGRSGEVTALRRGIGKLAPAERREAGLIVNDAVAAMELALGSAQERLEARRFDEELGVSIDVTFPSIAQPDGSIHPVRRIIEESCAYFARHGFAVVVGPEAEPDYYNFDALNIPADHPAREGFDSFWLTGKMLLRPHTSPMQIRTMQRYAPPIAIVAPGKCFRRDAVDARHLFQFHQVEGLLVAEGIHFGHLKGMLTGLCRELFGEAQRVRFRPSYFPFTEPSAEVDTTCPKCKGTPGPPACNMCGGSAWIELGGAGMVHPNVLREVGYDPGRYSGWAFGFGAERLALARYGVDDIRRFVTSETNFLEQLA